MSKQILALDVGGTFVKYGYFSDETGLDEASVGEFPMSEAGSREEIVEVLSAFGTGKGTYRIEGGTIQLKYRLLERDVTMDGTCEKLSGKAGILGGCILIFIGIEIFIRGIV